MGSRCTIWDEYIYKVLTYVVSRYAGKNGKKIVWEE